MRIVHIIKGLGRGGAERLLVNVQKNTESGGTVYGYAYLLPHKDALADDLRSAGAAAVECVPFERPGQIPTALAALVRFVQSFRADLIHAHLPLSGVIARVVGRWTRIPVVYTEHNLMPFYHPWTRRLHLATWPWLEHAVAVSGEVAKEARGATGRTVPITVVPNGVPLEDLRRDPARGSDLRRQLGVPAGVPVVGTVAVLRRQKRLDRWLEAARRIHGQRPDCRFVVVGDGPRRRDLQEHPAAQDLAAVLHWVGLQEDVGPFLDAFDVFLVSSDWEGMPVAILEAMAQEVPVVATAVGGVPEVLGDAEGGILVRRGVGDSEAGLSTDLARATLGILALDEEDRRRLGTRGRTRVADQFSTGVMRCRLEEIYQEVLRRSGVS